MEQNKYRERIQNSVIAPSDGSWEKLSKKLDKYDNDKKNNKRLFMKYAASMLIIISISFFFLPPENEISTDETTVSPEVGKTSIKPSVTNSGHEPYLASPTENSTVIKMSEPKPLANEIINYGVEESVAVKNEDNIEQNENSQRSVPKYYTTNTSKVTSKIVQQKIDTDYEVEELLKNAILNIEQNGQYLNKTKFSALDLLGEIENDLERDSRRKLFEKIIITIKNPTEIEITDRSK
jgi:hypothetical protein